MEGVPEPWGQGGYFLKDQPKIKCYHITVVKPMMMQTKFINWLFFPPISKIKTRGVRREMRKFPACGLKGAKEREYNLVQIPSQFGIKKQRWSYPRPSTKPKRLLYQVPVAHSYLKLKRAGKTENQVLIFLCTSWLSLSAISSAAPGNSSLYYSFKGFNSFLFFHSCKRGPKAQEEADAISEAPCCPLKH